jgi:SNF2 family DNA or RNA helicase
MESAPRSSPLWTYRSHQAKFIANEVKFRRSPGCVIDHELGSGKTLTVIGAIEALRRFPEYKEAPVIVLTLKALVDGFRNELEKSRNLQATRVDLYTITTVERFYLHPDEFKFEGGILVIDEAHKLRNPKSKRYRVIFQAAKKVLKTYLMSGTPIINYSVDIASLFNLILSDETRKKYSEAQAQYTKAMSETIRCGLNEKDLLRSGRFHAGYLPVTRTDWEKVFQSGSVKAYMRCLVSHHEEDHQSEEYKSHFPEAKRYAVKVSMAPEHYAAYKREAAEEEPNKKCPKMFKRQLDADLHFTANDIRGFQERVRRGPQLSDTKDVRFLAWIMRLRMACNQVRGSDGVEYMPKIAHATLHIIEQCRSNPHYKATLTTTFIARGIRLAQRLLRQAGISFVTITGRREDVKDSADIQRHVEAYNRGAVRVMLFSAAGQHGLDLKGTYDAFILNPHWNKGLHRQAEARVIRYDSHVDCAIKSVNVYYYTTIFPPDRSARDVSSLPRTADEFLMELGQKKEEENKRLMCLIPNDCLESSSEEYLRDHMPSMVKSNLPHIHPIPAHPIPAPSKRKTPASNPAPVSANTKRYRITKRV